RKRYVARLTKLAFIAPSIADAIAEGRAPIGINLQMLMDGRLDLGCLLQASYLGSGRISHNRSHQLPSQGWIISLPLQASAVMSSEGPARLRVAPDRTSRLTLSSSSRAEIE